MTDRKPRTTGNDLRQGTNAPPTDRSRPRRDPPCFAPSLASLNLIVLIKPTRRSSGVAFTADGPYLQSVDVEYQISYRHFLPVA